jgi:hypothetical protein
MRSVGVEVSDTVAGVDWVAAKADLVADRFDNGRSPAALQRSFEQSQYAAIAREQTDDAHEFWSLVVGTWLDNDADA